MLRGSDTDQLIRLSHRLTTGADRIDAVVRDVRSGLNRVVWLGGDAEQFRHLLDTDVGPRATRCTARLLECAEELKRQARQQTEASAADHGGAGGTPRRSGPRDLPDPGPGVDEDRDNQPEAFGVRSFAGLPLIADGMQPSDVQQGGLGNCYFAAAIAAMAATPQGRNRMARMIHDNKDGTYTVTFPGKEPVTVDADLYVGPDGEPAYGAPKGELWAVILEKAYAEHNGGYAGLEDNGGGRAADVFRDFGYNGQTTELGDLNDRELGELLTSAKEQGRAVTASATLYTLDGSVPDGALTYGGDEDAGHAFSITHISRQDTDGNMFITVSNPWGQPGSLGAPPGVTLNSNGTFTVDLDTFRSMFANVQYVSL